MSKSALDKYHIISPYLFNNSSLSNISNHTNINLRTLQRWISQYNQNGLEGLNRKKRSDCGNRRKVEKKIQEVIEGLVLSKQRLSISNITKILEEYCLKNKCGVVNYHTVRRIVQSLPKDITTLAQCGDKAYADKYEIIMRRESKYPNQIWQVDHSLLNVQVIQADKSKEKPWLTIIIDDYSRAIMGFSLFTGAPSAMQTALTLRKAIWFKEEPNWPFCGIPGTLYTDHGSDFTSTHIEHVCADLKIRLIHSAVGKPRGRGKVERFFLSLEQKLIEKLNFNKKDHSLEELERAIKKFIIEEYHHTIHSTTKATPTELWNKHQIIPRMPESIEKLNLLLLRPKKLRVVQRDGIHFCGLKYFHPNLAAYVGECIMIRYDPSDLGEIWVYDQNQFICKAVCDELQDQNISYKELKSTKVNRRSQLKQQIKDKTCALQQFFIEEEQSQTHKKIKSKLKLYQNE